MDSLTLLKNLEQVRKTKAANYEVRTEHHQQDGSPKYINRLIREDSPYLLQHAHNPVNWYPWGDEAFAAAQKANKPLFLSIGYSTCHWCHVMEVESFDNEAVAELLNRFFISIKVDREQRPDLDEIYMMAVQLISGQGGWPMSSFLTPDGKPFFGGTYFPEQQFKTLLTHLGSVWLEKEQDIRKEADGIAQKVNQHLSSSVEAAILDNELLSQCLQQMLSRYDKVNGGFSAAPKFPNETNLLFLLDQFRRSEHAELDLRKVISHTLDRMAQGGIYDQVAGGFHRYSTDSEWLVPHFEKMLYNQALLGRVYAQSYFLTANHFHQQIARETFDYVLRDMTAPSGGFYSATDADSEGVEGTFFLWDQQQLKKLLSAEDYQFIESLYGISAGGNFEGRNILYLPRVPKIYESGSTKPAELKQWQGRLEAIKHQLYLEREKRIHPFKDKKIITAWNGMMITGLAAGAMLLNEPRYLTAAQQAADYLWNNHFDQTSGLFRVSLEGAMSIQATQEDYAYFAEGLIALYDNSGEKIWLDRAQQLIDKMVKNFMDVTAGGFYLTGKEAAGPLISKVKSTHDGAIPSGNSVALSALVSIAGKTESVPNQQVLQKTLAYLSGKIKQQGMSQTYALLAVSEALNGETGPRVTLANGHIRATVVWLEPSTQHFEVTLVIDDGWHINADKIPQKNLIPTSLALQGVTQSTRAARGAGSTQSTRAARGAGPGASQHNLTVDYPPANAVSVAFMEEDLLLFSGTVVIKCQLLNDVVQPVKLKLVLQACTDDRCLVPEERVLIIQTVR